MRIYLFLFQVRDPSILYATNDITSIISFMMMWIATCMLLRHYSRKMGKIKFWILVSIPLVYFLSQFFTLSLNLFGPLLSSQSIFYGVLLTLVFTLSKSAGGILFGIAFWTAIRNIHESSVVRNYMHYFCIWASAIVYFKSSQCFGYRPLSTIWPCSCLHL